MKKFRISLTRFELALWLTSIAVVSITGIAFQSGNWLNLTASLIGVTALIFRRDKAKRYYLYGLGMLLLYVPTGLRLYAVPGMACLTMAVMCMRRQEGDAL